MSKALQIIIGVIVLIVAIWLFIKVAKILALVLIVAVGAYYIYKFLKKKK